MAKGELESVLDYILNRAGETEFEVIVKACERRRKDMGRYAAMGGLNPGAMAGRMAASLTQGVGGTMDGLRDTVRGFVERIIREKAPEATDEQVEALLAHYVPDPAAREARDDEEAMREAGASALPAAALALMLRDFTEYSLGLMAPSRQKELWEQLPRWQDQYWEAFPPALKTFIKARLEGRMDEEEFWQASLSLLGL